MIILFSPFEPSQKELIDNAYNFCLVFLCVFGYKNIYRHPSLVMRWALISTIIAQCDMELNSILFRTICYIFASACGSFALKGEYHFHPLIEIL